MIALNLQTKTPEQVILKDYLESNVSDILAEKIDNGTPFEKDGKQLINRKNLDGFLSYACEEAKKLAEKGARSACVEDKTVFGWAIHYFEEDSIEGTLFNQDGTPYKQPKPKYEPKPTEKPAVAKPKPNPQASLFDLFDMTPEKPKETVVDEETGEIYDCGEKNDTAEQEPKQAATEPVKPIQQSKPSPLYQRYMTVQNAYPTSVVAMRLGDFYEAFGESAITVTRELDLALTGRDCGLNERVPMCGFPYHYSEKCFEKLNEKYDLVIIESNDDKETRYLPKAKCGQFATNNEDLGDEPTDEELQEIYRELAEEEMRKFDGDIYEPKDVPDAPDDELNKEQKLAKAFDKETLIKLSDILGDIFILR